MYRIYIFGKFIFIYLFFFVEEGTFIFLIVNKKKIRPCKLTQFVLQLFT